MKLFYFMNFICCVHGSIEKLHLYLPRSFGGLGPNRTIAEEQDQEGLS